MSGSTDQNRYDIEKTIYETQWTNIRHHWTQTFAGVTFLSTLIAFAAVPIQYLRTSTTAGAPSTVDPYVKTFVALIILLLGVVTLLNQYNHHKRSQAARTVVVAIEKKWGLYDMSGRFIYQDPGSNYAYGKFAGGERRLTHSAVQFVYIIVITLAAFLFVLLA